MYQSDLVPAIQDQHVGKQKHYKTAKLPRDRNKAKTTISFMLLDPLQSQMSILLADILKVFTSFDMKFISDVRVQDAR